MNSNQRTTESSQLKQQVLNDIQKVKDDFTEIKNRLTPGQIIDEAIYYNRGAGAPADTFTYLKENPVGTAFLTLGTLLLMEGKDHHSYEYAARGRISDAKDRVNMAKGKVQSAVQDAKSKASQMKDSVTSKFGKGKDDLQAGSTTGIAGIQEVGGIESTGGTSFSDVKSEVQSKISDVGSNVQSSLSDAKSGMQSKLSDAKSKLTDTASRAKERFAGVSDTVKTRGHELYESSKNLDPMTYIALGAGLGTITGASIPVADAESQFFDSKFEGKFSNFSQELQDALNQSVNILKNEFIGGITDIKMDLF